MRRFTNVLLPAFGDPMMATLSNSEFSGMSGRRREIAVCSAKKITREECSSRSY